MRSDERGSGIVHGWHVALLALWLALASLAQVPPAADSPAAAMPLASAPELAGPRDGHAG